jgi:hypothetical protein
MPCVILTPYHSQIEPACEAGLKELERRGYAVRRVRGYAAVDQARNQMATDALAEGCSETLWIDADIGFHPDDVEKLRAHRLPIVCALYPQKGKRALACHVLPGEQQITFGQKGGLIEVQYAGCGFMLVRREVYVTMQERLGLPTCNLHFGRPMVPFFLPLVREGGGERKSEAEGLRGRDCSSLPTNHGPLATDQLSPTTSHQPPTTSPWYLAEDFAFCERARQCGYQVIADTSIRLLHFGSYGYTWEDAGADPQRWGTYHFHLQPSDKRPGRE